MGVAGALTKIVSKPAVLASILTGAGGFGIGAALLGGGSTQTTDQTTTSGDVPTTTNTPSTNYQYDYDYSTKNVSTYVIDSPFASVDTGMSGGNRASQEPDVRTEAASGAASSSASTSGGPDLLVIAGIGAAVLGGIYLVSRGNK